MSMGLGANSSMFMGHPNRPKSTQQWQSARVVNGLASKANGFGRTGSNPVVVVYFLPCILVRAALPAIFHFCLINYTAGQALFVSTSFGRDIEVEVLSEMGSGRGPRKVHADLLQQRVKHS